MVDYKNRKITRQFSLNDTELVEMTGYETKSFAHSYAFGENTIGQGVFIGCSLTVSANEIAELLKDKQLNKIEFNENDTISFSILGNADVNKNNDIPKLKSRKLEIKVNSIQLDQYDSKLNQVIKELIANKLPNRRFTKYVKSKYYDEKPVTIQYIENDKSYNENQLRYFNKKKSIDEIIDQYNNKQYC